MLTQILASLPPVAHASRRSRPVGLLPGTLVQTAEGGIPVEFLLAGDIVMTRNGPVELRGTSMVMARDFDVVVIEPGAPVADVPPAQPLIVPADQQVLVRDWRATILHGQSEMLTPAASLVDDVLVRRETRARQRLIRLHFDAPQVIRAGGVEVASARTRAPNVEVQRRLH
jgi:hypothetical protein